MITAGIDTASHTGMALVGEGQDRGKQVYVNERGFLRLHLIANDVSQTLHVWKPEFVAIEHYAYVRNIKSFVTLVEIGTVVRVALRSLGLPWLDVPPTVLKKWVTGKGTATKEQMAAAVNERWQYLSRSDDIVDAYALAQMAQLGWSEMLKITGVTIGWATTRYLPVE